MKIQFLGAAKTVSGSCYLIKALGKSVAIDCGLHQGNKAIEERNRNVSIYNPKALDYVLLTHAHIDHAGLLPMLTRHGFRGVIYCTHATLELLRIMLLDSAHIQELEANTKLKKANRRGLAIPEPLYTMADAKKTLLQIKAVDYHINFEIAPNFSASFYEAGHILGSATLRLVITEDKQTTSLIFSGDLGRPKSLILRDPEVPPKADYVFVETTYGDRDHKSETASLEELEAAIQYSYKLREKIIIPAFAVERTQEILCCLHILHNQHKLPPDLPIFVDSPLAIKASEVFSRHRNLFDAETQKLLGDGDDIFALPNLHYTLSKEESQQINDLKGSCVIISAAGMCNAGRIKHHLRYNLWKEGASIVFVGYQAQGTLGRQLVDNAKKITLFGEDITVAAKIFTINGFSGHAGQSQLLKWVTSLAGEHVNFVLVHGEEKALESFSQLLLEKLGIKAAIPDYLEEMELHGPMVGQTVLHAQQAYPAVNWNFLTSEVERKWAMFKDQLATLEHKPWVDQKDVEQALVKMEFYLTRLISRL